MRGIIFISIMLIVATSSVFSQSQNIEDKNNYKNSVETSPMSPFMQMAGKGIWGIKYDYAFGQTNELKLGIAYMNLHYQEGNTNSPALIIGYRRFLWKRLYTEYELWPCYDEFYEKNENKYYKGFDLWNEFRLGYQFNFRIKEFPMFVNVAWPFGFGLYSSNKPESFYDRMNQSFGDKFFFKCH
ncbi:MAG: hypothetical protein AB7S48_00680 [Bacteroidales bacterium]